MGGSTEVGCAEEVWVMRTTYRYAIHDHGETFATGSEFDSALDVDDGRLLAERAAEHHHENGNGWESYYPLTIEIFTMDGVSRGVFDVDREAVPYFFAVPKRG